MKSEERSAKGSNFGSSGKRVPRAGERTISICCEFALGAFRVSWPESYIKKDFRANASISGQTSVWQILCNPCRVKSVCA
ncbi:MAG: hypothetical protein ACLQBD_04010, partial [Syntrophobacteraceae bacterium]